MRYEHFILPWYIEHFLPQYTADENIRNLCFEKGGVLTQEFDRIFHDLYTRRGEVYKSILLSLQEGMKTLHNIRKALDYQKSGTLSKLINHLIISGFVTQHSQWSFKTGKERRQSLYRLNDPYVRFYLKYIEPNASKIEKGAYQTANLHDLPGYETLMGFQMECLLLQNRSEMLHALRIYSGDIVFDNSYLQAPTSDQKGCQIDYLIQTRTQNLFVCEIKFRRKELGNEIMSEVQTKPAIPAGKNN